MQVRRRSVLQAHLSPTHGRVSVPLDRGSPSDWADTIAQLLGVAMIVLVVAGAGVARGRREGSRGRDPEMCVELLLRQHTALPEKTASGWPVQFDDGCMALAGGSPL